MVSNSLTRAVFRNRGSAPRTVYNNIQSILTFFRRNGIDKLLVTADMPRYVEKKVAAYNESELKALFAAADDEERLAYQFFLYSGAREREVSHSTWRDIDFQSKTFTITAKPDLGFTPKDFEERSVPLPDALVETLQERRRLNPDSVLFLRTSLAVSKDTFSTNETSCSPLWAELRPLHQQNSPLL